MPLSHSPKPRKRTFRAVSYVLALASTVALVGLMAVTPQVSWSAPNSDPILALQPGEMPTQAMITAASNEAELHLAALTVETLPEPEPEPEPEPVVQTQSAPVQEPTAPPAYDGGGSPESWMSAAGIAPSDWGYVNYIASRESGWNPGATNPSSGACGLIQAYPCSKVPGSGYDPVDNLSWANGYAQNRYGSWESAYNFWVANHWW